MNSIDQTFLRTPAGNCGDMGDVQGYEEVTGIWGDDTPYTHSDHNALLTTIHLTEHGLLKPSGLQSAPDTGERRLVLPLTQDEHRTLQTRTRVELREALQDIQEMARDIREWTLAPFQAGQTTREQLLADREMHTRKADELVTSRNCYKP